MKKNLIRILVIFVSTFCVMGYSLAIEADESKKLPENINLDELPIYNSKQHKVILTPLLKSLSPNPIEVRQGDIIVWHNQDTKPVVIVFTPGIAMACSSKTITFPADQEGFYKTARIPHGGTVSMCFIIEGDYDYGISRDMEEIKEKPIERIVKEKPVEYILRGKVIVKK